MLKKRKKKKAIRHLVVGGGVGVGGVGLYNHHCYILYCHIESNTLNSNVLEIFFPPTFRYLTESNHAESTSTETGFVVVEVF